MMKYEPFIYPNARIIAGVDEVGRGPLIGDVVAAAVILSPNDPIEGLADSKTLSEKRRNALYQEIVARALAWGVGSATVQEIDELNILKASMLAMQRAVSALSIQPDIVLVDGNRCPSLPMPSIAVVKGDQRVAEISAGSIVAKVIRDAQMVQLDKQYPQYGLAKHKGYPTAAHLSAIEEHGITHHHRTSFSPIRRYLEKNERSPFYSSASTQ